MARILIVADAGEALEQVRAMLSSQGYQVTVAETPASAGAAARAGRPDLALVGLGGSVAAAIATMNRLRREAPRLPVVITADETDLAGAVAAVKAGAIDVFQTPLDRKRLAADIDALLAVRRGTTASLKVPAVGRAPRFDEAMQLALRFAVPDINILLVGETGTGKEVFARLIHGASKRSPGPFVPLDCSVLPSELVESELFGHEKGAFTGATFSKIGRFEMAQGGTLFLDEIANLPPAVQAKLLRVLQVRRFTRVGGREPIRLDVRLVAATNVDLVAAVEAGAFRRDLYYRFNEVTIEIPPLRDRPGDVELLARHFLVSAAASLGRPARKISPEALRCLDAYAWPGNVRELENAVRSAVVLAEEVVLPENLPAAVRAGVPRAGTRYGEQATRAPSAVTTAVERPPAGDGGSSGRLRVALEFEIPEGDVDLKAVAAEAAERAERAVLTALVARGVRSVAELARLVHVDDKTLRDRLRRFGLSRPRGR